MAAVPAQDVLDDREAEAGAAELARARLSTRKKRSVRRGRCSRAMPGPGRRRAMRTAGRPASAPAAIGPRSSRSQTMSTGLPSPPYLIALSTRLLNSWNS